MGFFGGLSRAYGQFDKNVMGGLLPGGAQIAPQISGTVLAAQEAVPAIVQGALGLGDRTDRSINPRIHIRPIPYTHAEARHKDLVLCGCR